MDWIASFLNNQFWVFGFIFGFLIAGFLGLVLNIYKQHIFNKKIALHKEMQLNDKILIATYETKIKQEQKSFEEKYALLEDSKQSMLRQFKELSSVALKENATQFSHQQHNQLKNILSPLHENIYSFQQQVNDIYDKEMRERVSLKSEIKNIVQSSRNLGDEAQKLSHALSAQSKTQGIWGEVVLESLLQNAGLSSPLNYQTQKGTKTLDDKQVILDVLLHLPDDKEIIIDAKVSLRPWMHYLDAQTEDEKSLAYKELEKAIQYHVDDLSQRGYDRLPEIETLDSILMFIPQEAVLALINKKNPDFFTKALKKNILIVTPSTLMLSLRIINHLWKLDQQDRHARQIIIEAQALHKKFAIFLEHLNKVKNALNTADKAYEMALNSMSGRGGILKRIQNLEDMGVSSEKEIDEKIRRQIEGY